MRTTNILFSCLLVFISISAKAEFFEDFGKNLSMQTCTKPNLKAAADAVLLNKNQNKPQVWTFKLDKQGKLVNNPDPRNWYTIYDKNSLAYFCFESRFSRFVMFNRLEVSPALNVSYFCGHKVYSCNVTREHEDKKDNGTVGTPGDSDGGNTDGGNTDGGNTDGGNTDGGNTDGGNTDGGNTDGGNTDGGNTDGGNTDGGNTDGRPDNF
jgi:hypothetical protein